MVQEEDLGNDQVQQMVRKLGKWDGRLAPQVRAHDSSRLKIGFVKPSEISEEDLEALEHLDTQIYDRLGQLVSPLSVTDKMRELIEWVRKNNDQIPTVKSTDTFTDGTRMGNFWHHCKREGWAKNNQKAYKDIE